MASETSLTRSLIATLWAWKVEDFTEDDLRAARTLLLDHIAVAAWGSRMESGKIMCEHALGDIDTGKAPFAPIIGTGITANVTAAAMANATSSAAYEFDDTHTTAQVHAGVVIFPAALAGTLLGDGTEETLLRSLIIGYEVMVRVANASNPTAHRARHFQPTATAGHFGAAAAAAVGLGLTVDEAVAALTLSGTVAGGSMQFLVEGAWTKQAHPAFAVERGIQGAQLAKRGFPGVKDPIAGERAFLNAQSDAPRPEMLLANLNNTAREIRNTGIKAYPTCRHISGPLDLVFQLQREHDLKADEIERMTFGLINLAMITVWDPIEVKRRPDSTVAAQFSLPYCAAVALINRTVGPDQFRLDRLQNPEVLELIDRIECVNDPALDARYPADKPAWLKIETKDGRTFEAHIDNPNGEPSNPISNEALLAKFLGVSVDIYTDDQRETIQNAVLAFPQRGSLEKLLSVI